MNQYFGKILWGTMYGVFLFAFAWVSGQLFFEHQTNNLVASVTGIFADDSQQKNVVMEELKVIYSDEPEVLDPAVNEPVMWKRLINIYEPLLKMDRDLNIQPSLAVEWGLIDEMTWEFRLRPDVRFHDGSSLDVTDVVASIERSKNLGALTSIDKVESVEGAIFRINTVSPDPLLLQKLSRVLIFPSEFREKQELPVIGTGSYRLGSWEKGKVMNLERFDGYWGEPSKFKEVQIFYMANKSDRVNSFLEGDADLLDFVPYDAVYAVVDKGFKIVSMPSLQVESIYFNTKSDFFRNESNRQLISLLVDQDHLIGFLGGYAQTVTQFISAGVFGFNPEIGQHKYDLEAARKIVEKNGLKGNLIQIHFPRDFSFLGEYLRAQIIEVGLVPVVSYMEMDKLGESMKNGDADLYFLGYRAELGDADDFFATIPYSRGDFNVANYENFEVDSLIDASKVEMDQVKRLIHLQKAMRIIVEDDVIGIPLFEYRTLFTFSDKIRLVPRIDGFVYFDDLIIRK